MATQDYVPPSFGVEAYHCPHCGTFAHQNWYDVHYYLSHDCQVHGWRTSRCRRCGEWAMWRESVMIYPSGGSAPLPNADMPEDIKRDYEEARAILSRSPRGAAALLRLAIQKLCKALGEPGKDINSDIKALVQKGLSASVQKALDIVRVTGNGAVHPGVIDLRDDPALAGALFKLVNLIVEKMITEPRVIDDLYAGLPAEKLNAIEKRDGTG